MPLQSVKQKEELATLRSSRSILEGETMGRLLRRASGVRLRRAEPNETRIRAYESPQDGPLCREKKWGDFDVYRLDGERFTEEIWCRDEKELILPTPALYIWKSRKPDSVLIAIYLVRPNPRLPQFGPNLAAYLVLLHI